MAGIHDWMFYEVLWRHRASGRPFPFPWWTQQYFRRWTELPGNKEEGFASNALYRYWNMVGVKDHHQECLVGQAGEVEPVRDPYTLIFFLFDPAARRLYFPQEAEPGGVAPALEQGFEAGYLPVVRTVYRPPIGLEVGQKVI